jgi:hypothetical protein
MTRARQLNYRRQRFLLYFGVREMMVGVISLLRHPSRGRVHRYRFPRRNTCTLHTLAAISPLNVDN